MIADSRPARSFAKLLSEDDDEPGAGADCNVSSALWADGMSPEASAFSTLVRKVPSGSVPLVERGLDCSTCVRYFCAELRSPD